MPPLLLKVQEYLQNNPLDQLKQTRALRVVEHRQLPLVILDYDQIESPRSDPIVRECRGTVLEKDTWALIGKSFNRFFNYGEFANEMKKFEWEDCQCITKEDGTLINLFYYEGEWHVTTRGTFGTGRVHESDRIFRDVFWEYTPNLQATIVSLDPQCTYSFELCTPLNNLITRYTSYGSYLIGCVNTLTHYEATEEELDALARRMHVLRPARYKISSAEEARDIVLYLEGRHKTNEGIVLRDRNNLRYKWKTDSFRALNKIRENGAMFIPRRITDIVLTGNAAEIKDLFPDSREALELVEQKVTAAFEDLVNLWEETKDVSDQKEFARLVGKYPFSGILFNTRRKFGRRGSRDDIYRQWRDLGAEKISNILFKDVKRFKPTPLPG